MRTKYARWELTCSAGEKGAGQFFFGKVSYEKETYYGGLMDPGGTLGGNLKSASHSKANGKALL